MVVYMYSGQRRSAGSAQVSGEQVPEMDGSMALIHMVPREYCNLPVPVVPGTDR